MNHDHRSLRSFVTRILRAGGANEDEAVTTAEHLVLANLSGHDSHGVGLLPGYCRSLEEGKLVANQGPEVVSSFGSIAVWDGHGGFGQVIARDAMTWAIATAREQGVAVHGLRNTHHIGRVGTYGEMAAAAGMVSVHFVNGTAGGGPVVAPFGGRESRHLTNPVCIAVPGTATTAPVILDFATSRIAMGKVRVAHNKGLALMDGVLLDRDGAPTTDPGVMFREPRGVVMPFGEHKGSGLALACDLLCGAIVGMGTLRDAAPADHGVRNGMLTFVLDPARMASRDFMDAEIDGLVAWVKSSAAIDPAAPVLVAGEPERIARARRVAEGIPIDDTTWGEILEAAARLQVRPDG